MIVFIWLDGKQNFGYYHFLCANLRFQIGVIFGVIPKLVFLTILGTPRQVEGEDYETALKSRVFIEFHQCFILHVFLV